MSDDSKDEPEQPWAGIPATGPLLRPGKAAEYLGYSRSHYYNLARRGLVPMPLHIGRGDTAAVGVPKPWLDALIAHCAERDRKG